MSVTSSMREVRKIFRTSVYRPGADDLVELREIAGLTQKKAAQMIFGHAGRGRWPIWELQSKHSSRPGSASSLIIHRWAMSYSPATRAWAMDMMGKELRKRMQHLTEAGGKVLAQRLAQLEGEGEEENGSSVGSQAGAAESRKPEGIFWPERTVQPPRP